VVVQAGASEAGRERAAETAEVIFVAILACHTPAVDTNNAALPECQLTRDSNTSFERFANAIGFWKAHSSRYAHFSVSQNRFRFI